MHQSTTRYPYSQDRYRAQASSGSSMVAQEVNQLIHESIVVSAMGTWVLIKSIFSRFCPITIIFLGMVIWAGHYIASEALHIQFIHELEPRLFTMRRLQWMYKVPMHSYWVCLTLLMVYPVVLALGIYARSLRTKYQLIFNRVGLLNGVRDTPKLVCKRRIDAHRTCYTFDGNGIGVSEFEARRERLEANFGDEIEAIKCRESNKKHIDITFNKLTFPTKITYAELAKERVLTDGSFFVGQTKEGIHIQNLTRVHHMMIAGATGSGKSVFFKSVILGLLESSKHIQGYFIDLKGGLEMSDFSGSPNVKVIKSMDAAVAILKAAEKEMKSRFSYLESKGRKEIVPSRDKKDRIIIAVDEASVLYATRNAHDSDRSKALEARTLADSIAKLGRAAGVHLLLATQKVENQFIPSSVSENLMGRMVFRVNSFQGSNQVIGSKQALDLPAIPGRGLWSCGTELLMAQAPYVDEVFIKKRCKIMSEEFHLGERKCFQPMLGDLATRKVRKAQKEIYEFLSGKEVAGDDSCKNKKG